LSRLQAAALAGCKRLFFVSGLGFSPALSGKCFFDNRPKLFLLGSASVGIFDDLFIALATVFAE